VSPRHFERLAAFQRQDIWVWIDAERVFAEMDEDAIANLRSLGPMHPCNFMVSRLHRSSLGALVKGLRTH
jgi:hypothetical protein